MFIVGYFENGFMGDYSVTRWKSSTIHNVQHKYTCPAEFDFIV